MILSKAKLRGGSVCLDDLRRGFSKRAFSQERKIVSSGGGYAWLFWLNGLDFLAAYLQPDAFLPDRIYLFPINDVVVYAPVVEVQPPLDTLQRMGHPEAVGQAIHPEEQTLDHVVIVLSDQPDLVHPVKLAPFAVVHLPPNEQVELEPFAHPDPGILSMIFSPTQSSACVAPVEEARTLSSTSAPTFSTCFQGMRTSLLPPVIRCTSRPTRGPIRRARGSGPTRRARTMGRVSSRSSTSTPATFVTRSPSESNSWLSTMSRISSSFLFIALASGNYRERHGSDAYDERQHDDQQYGGISKPVVRLVPQVHLIVHNRQEGYHHYGQDEGGEDRGVNRQLDRVYPRKPHQERAPDDVEGADEIEDGSVLGLSIFPVLPTHDLRYLVGERQGYLRGRSETRDKERGGKQVHPPDPEHINQP